MRNKCLTRVFNAVQVDHQDAESTHLFREKRRGNGACFSTTKFSGESTQQKTQKLHGADTTTKQVEFEARAPPPSPYTNSQNFSEKSTSWQTTRSRRRKVKPPESTDPANLRIHLKIQFNTKYFGKWNSLHKGGIRQTFRPHLKSIILSLNIFILWPFDKGNWW